MRIASSKGREHVYIVHVKQGGNPQPTTLFRPMGWDRDGNSPGVWTLHLATDWGNNTRIADAMLTRVGSRWRPKLVGRGLIQGKFPKLDTVVGSSHIPRRQSRLLGEKFQEQGGFSPLTTSALAGFKFDLVSDVLSLQEYMAW